MIWGLTSLRTQLLDPRKGPEGADYLFTGYEEDLLLHLRSQWHGGLGLHQLPTADCIFSQPLFQ